MISLRGVSKTFDGAPVLTDVNLVIDAGSRVSIIGPGGCGKTTILKTVLGILPPDSGSVEVMGVNMFEAGEAERYQVLRQVGMAFQQGALFDSMTVRENLLFAMEHMIDLPAEQMEERIKHLLSQVKLTKTLNQFPYELSGGMQRRVGIARALSTNPKLAIFDEPTSGLDPVTSTIILNMIRAISGDSPDITSVIATSSVEIAIRFAKRLVVLNEGKVVADGDWQDLLISGPEWVKHFLSVRLIGIDLGYAKELLLPQAFIDAHWNHPQ
jgi:phospholipid/cholesterol/gamma-HCH transport system ATP-binding protein